MTVTPRPPAQWHRVLTLLADVSLFIGTRSVWARAAGHLLPVAAVISACYASILVCGVLALVVRRERSLARIDLCVLVTAVVLALCALTLYHQGSDEADLTAQAARELVAGHAVYGQSWPWLFGHGVALTPTVTGGYDFTYGYPPLAPLLTAPLLWLGHGGTPATVVATVALVVGTVVLWRLLPRPWRPAATMVCLGFGMLPVYGRLGYPAILALALLVPVVVRWPRIGRGGRLGPAGLAQAACLGAACAAQQLPWFLAPFLLVGIHAVRRGELGARAAALVVLRVVGVAVTVWLLINAYFVVSEPGAWFTGIALPLTQGAVLHGQGLVDVSLYLTDGSDRLDWYGHASLLLAGALLVLFVLFVRRLGPAATVLPWCAFYLATRSQDGYYLMMTPLWLAAAVTAPPSEFAGAWQPAPGPLSGPHRRPARVAAVVLLLTPALVGSALAVTGTPPLRMRVAGVHRASAAALSRLTLLVTNAGDSTLTPHFTLTAGQGMDPYWTVVRGPAALPAHTTARYELRPPTGTYGLPRPGARIRLRAFTSSPQTLSSTYVRLRPG
ncbi:hypothetical protein AQJ84_00155 [Streptomyces resistomycificus]|uniref:Membrane protein n=1 Tax=Streptomyces resistomycificus TaxID=67356 RepID=A0A0L8KYT8_9ACTN|nr:hypothetical protein [Streptomyces resistomycificus]KOG31108.1 membrane protein [Streptomyces resistomycificus]KUO02120.1 hypothetical protein AQJ84_00155 [Streptomyces resistomycificus]